VTPITKDELMQIIEPIVDTLVRKNHDYGGSVFELGGKGIFVRMWDKMARLKQLVWMAVQPKVRDEAIHDTIADLAGYAILWLVDRQRNAEADAFANGEMMASELSRKFSDVMAQVESPFRKEGA
jgi:hypothetical protein